MKERRNNAIRDCDNAMTRRAVKLSKPCYINATFRIVMSLRPDNALSNPR
jgi:hypothetical protein